MNMRITTSVRRRFWTCCRPAFQIESDNCQISSGFTDKGVTIIAVSATTAAATAATTTGDPHPDQLPSSSHTGGGGRAKRRDGLKRHCRAVAGDLTTRQQNITKQYRDDGIRAYYKGNQLVVGGRLRPRLQNGRKQDDAGGGGGRGTQTSQFPSFPIYSEVAQRSAIDGNATDVTTTTAWTQF